MTIKMRVIVKLWQKLFSELISFLPHQMSQMGQTKQRIYDKRVGGSVELVMKYFGTKLLQYLLSNFSITFWNDAVKTQRELIYWIIFSLHHQNIFCDADVGIDADADADADVDADADAGVGLVVFLCWHSLSLLLIECYCSDRSSSGLYSPTTMVTMGTSLIFVKLRDWYIFEKWIVQGYQKLYLCVSNAQV